MLTFMQMLAARASEGRRLCVGLDPVVTRIPDGVSVQRFLIRIAEATADFAAAFKPNVAFFEGRGAEGLAEYRAVVTTLRSQFPQIPVIGDWKRGDIGATNVGYVEAAFDQIDINAITVHPYLGKESLQVFLAREDRGIIVLCRTSNPGAGEFQDLIVDVSDDPILGQNKAPLYQVVARNVSRNWNGRGNCGLVVGATYPDELAKVHEIAPEVLKLIPGVGTQGGNLEASIRNAFCPTSLPDFVINVSSGVSYAYEKGPFKADSGKFDRAAAQAAADFDQKIRDVVAELS